MKTGDRLPTLMMLIDTKRTDLPEIMRCTDYAFAMATGVEWDRIKGKGRAEVRQEVERILGPPSLSLFGRDTDPP